MNATVFVPFKSGKRKNFYHYIKSICKDNYMEKDRFTNSCDLDKAEILNKYFASVFTQDPGSALPNLSSNPYPELPSFEASIIVR